MIKSKKFIILATCVIILAIYAIIMWWYLRQDPHAQSNTVDVNQEIIVYPGRTYKIADTGLEFKIDRFDTVGMGNLNYPIIEWITNGIGVKHEGCFEYYVELDNKYYFLNNTKTDHKTYGQYELKVYDKDTQTLGPFARGPCES